MSQFVLLYDSKRGTRRHGSQGVSCCKRIGTNLAGTQPWMNGFIPRNSGVFTWSGNEKEFWDEVLLTLSRDCILGIGPSLSVQFNRDNEGLMMCADIDAEVCEMWLPGQCMNLALTILEAYMETCPSLKNKEGEEPRPLFVYSEPSEIACKRVNCCKTCESANLSFENDNLRCEKCGKNLSAEDIVTKSSFKVGCHLNGIQRRDEFGSEVDMDKSGAILSTQQHLIVRAIAISLWCKYASEKSYLSFPCSRKIKKTRVTVDGIIQGILSSDGTTAKIIIPRNTGVCSGVHSVKGPEIDAEEDMNLYEARNVPPFPGNDTADIIIDAAVLGSTRTQFNGMMRAPFCPKANKNCTCSNAELGIRECYLCGSSVSRNESYKIEDDRRKYITTHYLMSDLTSKPIGVDYGRFDLVVKESDLGHRVGQVYTCNIEHVTDNSFVASDIRIAVKEVDHDGKIQKFEFLTPVEQLEYKFGNVKKSTTFIGLIICCGFKVHVMDNRLSHMQHILQETCGYLPSGTPNTPFEQPEKYNHMVQRYSIDTEKCDLSRGVCSETEMKQQSKASRKHTMYKSVKAVLTNQDKSSQRVYHRKGNGEVIRDNRDPRYKTLRRILLRHWGKDRNQYGIYTNQTTFTVSVSKSEPSWGRTGTGAKRKAFDSTPFYWVKIMNDRRCINAIYCAKHPNKKRMPFQTTGLDLSEYCQICDRKAYGAHRGQQTPVFMKVDIEHDPRTKEMIPKATLGCFSQKMGWKCQVCNFSKENDRRTVREPKLRKFQAGIHPWYRLKPEDIRVLYPGLNTKKKEQKITSSQPAAPRSKQKYWNQI